jgi:hypothetical protein
MNDYFISINIRALIPANAGIPSCIQRGMPDHIRHDKKGSVRLILVYQCSSVVICS